MALSGTGCGPADRETERPPAATAPTSGLVVLAGEPGATSLVVHDAAGVAETVALPDRGAAWISAAPTGRLVATLEGGEMQVSDPIGGTGDLAWSPVPAPDDALPPDPPLFGTWSPDGRRVAAIATDFGVESRLTVLVVEPIDGTTRSLPIPRRPVIAPPTWLDAERILVQTTTGLAIVEPSTGHLGAGPPLDVGPGVSIASAATGTLLAIAAPEGAAIDIRDRDAWLAGDRGDPGARISGIGEIGALALDGPGDRLAVLWQSPEAPGTVVVYARAESWREVARLSLPGESARAAIDWLPPPPAGSRPITPGRS